MKRRLISLLLAMVLLMALTGSAGAARVNDWTDAVPDGTTGGNVQVGEGNSVATGGTIDTVTGALTGEMQTEVWLRSIASAQIDATVPLVVLVTLNVGGGDAIAPGDDYQIINNGFVSLEVTNVDVTQPVASNVTLVESIAGLAVKDKMEATISFPLKNGATETNLCPSDVLLAETYNSASSDNNTIAAATVVNGVNTPTKKTIGLEMASTPLSFITATKDNQTSTTIDGTFGDKDKGVYVFNINYTLSATYAAVGETLHDANVTGYDDYDTRTAP